MEEYDNIDSYFMFINDHLESIDSITLEYHEKTYKKLLYMSVIDFLSQNLTNQKSPKIRVVNLLKKFSNWEYGSYVSLPHLLMLLQKVSNPSF